MALHLRNPHSVLAALERRPREVLEIRLTPSAPSAGWSDVVDAAKPHGIPVHTLLPTDRRREQRGEAQVGKGAAKPS